MTHAEEKRLLQLCSKKFRNSLGLFLIEGEKMVQEAVQSGLEIVGTYRKEEIGEQTMARISGMSTPAPVVAVVKAPAPVEITLGDGIYLALDAVRDPGNLGTIIRTAEWFGVKGIFLSDDCAELFNPKVLHSSMGSAFRMHVQTADIGSVARMFADRGRKVWGTFLDGADIRTLPSGSDGLIIMGNEANGISDDVARTVTDRITIPAAAGCRAESLNVATATACVLSLFALK